MTLPPPVVVCAWCRRVKTPHGWDAAPEPTNATHGICGECIAKHLPADPRDPEREALEHDAERAEADADRIDLEQYEDD